jgi:Cu(I)/Ag(I) efflux system membrane fusion protein
MGMPASQIERLAADRKPVYATTIVSPVSGFVTEKFVVPQQYVAEGQPLVAVADLSTVWVEADVFEQQLPEIRIGQRVAITSPALPGQTLPGTVAFIQPVLSGETRSTSVRIELPNRNLQLKPDMFVSVTFATTAEPGRLSVPASAVVDRGQQQFVWVELASGRFSPRQVQTGTRSGERIEILSGLSEGESVVVEGAFLLDSESQLRSSQLHSAQGH